MQLTRRDFGALSIGAGLLACGSPVRAVLAGRYPFTLGVASGDPAPDSVVLWTRLAPDPLAPDGGMPPTAVPVSWEIAEDEAFTKVLRGTAIADPAWGHSVHVEATGLRSGFGYFYRFVVGGVASPVARTRTTPRAGDTVNRLRIAFASCQQYEVGHYAAYRHMVADDPDVVLFLGDYIYENAPSDRGIRRHLTAAPTDLAGYRARYANYKLDPLLQAAHHSAPWIVTWDDHEVRDNYTGIADKTRRDPAGFARRRAAAYQAYYEHMPLRSRSRPVNGAMRLYRSLRWGDLAAIQILDDRQYRDTAPCQPAELVAAGLPSIHRRPDCPERHDPRRQLLGREQMAWLDNELVTTKAQWNFLGQQTLMMPNEKGPYAGSDGQPTFGIDNWDGFTASRDHIQRRWRDAKVRNPVVLSGDIHAFVAGDHFDPDDPRRIVASEFVGGSISSGSTRGGDTLTAAASRNRGFHLVNNGVRGYGLANVTAGSCEVALRSLADVRDPNSTIADLARFAVESGRPGVQRG